MKGERQLMLRSMYSGISGLKNFQTKLDVIGNNIANVNTYGFKKGRVIFKDILSQTSAGASAATTTRGGTNPLQVGLGSTLAAIDTVHGSGSRQTTDRPLDLAVQGEGFFMVADSVSNTDGVAEGYTNVVYTRAGNFYMDSEGYLVNAEGKYLVGHANDTLYETDSTESNAEGDKEASPLNGETEDLLGENDTFTFEDNNPIKIPTTAKSISIGQDGTVEYVDANGYRQYAGQIVMVKFPNAGGLEKVGSNYFQATANSGQPYGQVATVAGMGSITAGALEMSNVDLSEEFTEMIVAQRGFQANTRIITTSDEVLQELVNLKR